MSVHSNPRHAARHEARRDALRAARRGRATTERALKPAEAIEDTRLRGAIEAAAAAFNAAIGRPAR